MRDAFVRASLLATARALIAAWLAYRLGTYQGLGIAVVMVILEFTGVMSALSFLRAIEAEKIPIKIMGKSVSEYRQEAQARKATAHAAAEEKRERDHVEAVRQDKAIHGALLNLLLNETGAGTSIPREGIALTWRICRKHGMKQSEWKRLCAFVLRSGSRGWSKPGVGGKMSVMLKHSYIVSTLADARRFGKVGGVRHSPTERR